VALGLCTRGCLTKCVLSALRPRSVREWVIIVTITPARHVICQQASHSVEVLLLCDGGLIARGTNSDVMRRMNEDLNAPAPSLNEGETKHILL